MRTMKAFSIEREEGRVCVSCLAPMQMLNGRWCAGGLNHQNVSKMVTKNTKKCEAPVSYQEGRGGGLLPARRKAIRKIGN